MTGVCRKKARKDGQISRGWRGVTLRTIGKARTKVIRLAAGAL